MAKETTQVEYVDDDEFEAIKEESGEPVKFEAVGDTFTGVFRSAETIEFDDPKAEGENKKKTFQQYHFTGTDGKPYSINGGYQFDEILPTIAAGTKVRITLAALIPVNGQPSPMKDYRIEVAKPKASAEK